MPRNRSREEQTARYYRRRKINRVLSFVFCLLSRFLGIALTAVCIYWVFFDADAMKIKGFAAAALAVLLYAQCASLSMLGLRLFSKSTMRKQPHLLWIGMLICAPLYFVVFVVSVIPLTERAAFFLTVFPTLILNILPMESIRDEFSIRGFPKSLFWGSQFSVQLAVFAVGQICGMYLLKVWG